MQFQVPSPDWLKLSVGLLHFHFSDGWKDATPEKLLSSILFRLCEEHPQVDAELDDGTITVSRRHRDNDRVWHEVIGTYTIDEGFTYDSWLREVPTDEFRQAVEAVLTGFVARTEKAFRNQHAAGRCAIYARVGSPFERSFSEIPHDVFKHFTVSDWSRGVASSAAGEKLFSIHATATSDDEPELSLDDPIGTDSRKHEYPFEAFISWALEENVTRKFGSLEAIRRKYAKSAKSNGRELDDKTLRKAFEVMDAMQGN